MAVKIKLMRLGRIRQPYYRIVVADARTRRNGKAIETIGKYHPKEQPSLIEVDSERVQYWLGVGAQPTEPVQHILQVTGDWQRFKGLPGIEGTLQRAAPRPDKAELFNRALALAGEVPTTEATTPRKKAARQADAGPAPKDPAPKDPAPKDPAPKDPAPKDPAPKDPAPKDPAPKDPAPKDPAPATGTAATSTGPEDREDTATVADGQV